MHTFQPWEHYPLISQELKTVNQRIQENIKTSHSDLQTALLEMAKSGGKFLRPSLLLLSAQAVKPKQAISNQIINLAAAIEILHMATLIHDDIIDDSDQRRGRVSIQARFGKDTAVYAGDLLFTHFFDLLLATTNERSYLVENARTMHRILNGELGQKAQRFNLKQSLTAYLNDVKGKTAALFRLAAKEGAHFSGANETLTKALAAFGENLGIAFQIIDDILDYSGSAQLNKPTLEDLATGVYSLPLLLALRQPNLRVQLLPLLKKKRQMSLNDMQTVQALLLNSSVIADSRDLAQKYTDRARQSLSILPPSPAKTVLTQLPEKLLKRSF